MIAMSCEYCAGREKIRTEIDNEAYIEIEDNDPEYHLDGFTMDVFSVEDGNWMCSFQVPYCPMCGQGYKDLNS